MKRICAFLMITCVIFLSGCYDYHEINDTAMVSGISIDKGKEKAYKVSAEIIQPAGGEQSTPTAKVISEEGESVEDCLNRLVNVATKELHFTHCKLILFSKDVADDGISDFVDTFLRDPQFRADLYLAVVSDTDASEMLSVGEKEERICSLEFAAVIENSYTETGSVPPTKLYQFSMDGELSMLPLFKESEGTYSVGGVCAFRKGVSYAELELPQAQSILLVSGEYQQGELLLTTKDGISVPCQVRSVSLKRKVRDGDGLTVSAKIECKIRLTSLPQGIDISTKEAMKKTENELSRRLTEKIRADWEDALKDGISDVFGLSVYVYRHAPDLHEEWIDGQKGEVIQLEPECSVILENFGFTDERIVE